jgi:hypothetical protein
MLMLTLGLSMAQVFVLCAVACSLSIHDDAAAATMPGRRGQREVEPAPEPRAA